MDEVARMSYDVPGCRPVNEHVNGLSVDETVHSWDPSFMLALKDVIGEPGVKFGNVTEISVFDSAEAVTPVGAMRN